MLRKKTFFAILLAIAVVCSCSYGPAEAANPFKRNIEVVVGFSAGGGSDICARMFSTIINDEKYLPVRLNVINKPGANSGVAINYVGGKQKDPHYLLFITPGFVSTPLQTNSPINYTKFTPIAIFGFDDWFFVVKEGGDYKTFEDLVKAAKANPGKIRFGGPGAGGITQICLAEMADTVGIDVAYVPFLGGADIMTAILGGHIEAGVLNVSEVSSFIEAKQLHALATPGEKRISRFSHVPTLTALKAGADSAHVTVNGLGEKTGNCDLAELAIALYGLYGVQTNLKLDKLRDLSKLVEGISGIRVSGQKPLVGDLAFARESGLVVAQLLSYPPSVEGYDPAVAGREREIALGKKSGRKSVEYALGKIGAPLPDTDTLDKLLVAVKQLGIRKKGCVTLDEFKEIVKK